MTTAESKCLMLLTFNNQKIIQKILGIDDALVTDNFKKILVKAREIYFKTNCLDEDFFNSFDLREKQFDKFVNSNLPKIEMIDFYLEEIKKDYIYRNINHFKQGLELKELNLKLEQLLNLSKNENVTKYKQISLKNVAIDFYTNLDKQKDIIPIKTHFPKMDRYIQMLGGDLIIVAGRPGMAKTGVIMNCIKNMTKEKKGIFFSLEMTETAIINRMMSLYSQVPLAELKDYNRFQNLNNSDMAKINQASEELTKLDNNLKIISGSFHIKEIKDIVMSLKGEIDFIVVDYLQLLKSNGKDINSQGTEISLTLKEIAMELNIPVIALSQLSREVEKRANKEPQLSDLRNSGK